jgi:hypothetical protein
MHLLIIFFIPDETFCGAFFPCLAKADLYGKVKRSTAAGIKHLYFPSYVKQDANVKYVHVVQK